MFFGYKNRPEYQHPEYGYTIFMPAVFGVLLILIYLYYYFGELLYATITVKLSFAAALSIMLTAQSIMLFLAVFLIVKLRHLIIKTENET
jgi:CBS domain containing-hemolysin-like protein